MGKKLLAALAALFVVLLVVVGLQPATFEVSRTATMAAPPAEVFAQVNDFHRWEAWNPWQKIDPAARNTYSGLPAGEGEGDPQKVAGGAISPPIGASHRSQPASGAALDSRRARSSG